MNYSKHPLYLTGIVVVLLLLLSFIPEGITKSMGMKHIDILSDIRKDTVTPWENQMVLLPPPPAPPEPTEIPCPLGMICFEDFSENNDGLDNFFRALDNAKEGNPVRIAFFGDSYIEGDIFSADLRHNLQEEFGGRGVGLVPVTSQTAGFRRTVKHNFGGWKSYSIIDTVRRSFAKMSIAGNHFVSEKNAWIKYTGVDRPNLDWFKQVSIMYILPEGNAEVSYKINGEKEAKTIELQPTSKVGKYDIREDSINNIQLNFPENLTVLGISLENNSGVLVDNFSLRGAPGTTLKFLPEDILKQTNELLGYDLIILQYGLNVMSARQTNYSAYQKGMEETVEHLKKCFPNTGILLLSVGDRSMRSNDDYVTMPGVPALVSHQQAVCAQTGIVFWNLFEAMGGNGSMPQMLKAQPPRANKDYTHLNFEGGKYLGELLFKTIVFEKERYNKLRKNKRPVKKPS